MKKAKKTAKKTVELTELPGMKEAMDAFTRMTDAFSGIRDELRGIRSELVRLGGNNLELEGAIGRLGQRIGEFIEHQFHSVK